MLEPVAIDDPVVVPAVPEQVFDLVWTRRLAIDLPGPNQPQDVSVFRISVCPMSSTGDLYAKEDTVQTARILEAAREVPEIAEFFNALAIAVPKLKAWIAMRS